MATHSEDLEYNPFYQALQTRFSVQYEQAQSNCWLVCIPTAASLEGCNISKQFVDLHLLQPSALFRDEYESIFVNQRLKWRVKGNSLRCVSSGVFIEATVLAEELAYNRSLRQYKMFILERPLDPNFKPPAGGVGRLHDVIRLRKTYREYKSLLSSFARWQQGLEELDQRLKTFMINYVVVERESLLRDTSAKLEKMAKQAAIAFAEANRSDILLQDRRVQESVMVAIEGYLMHHVHSKIYPAVCRVHQREDALLADRCRQLRGNLTPEIVGVSSDYNCPYPFTLGKLNKLQGADSPLEKIHVLHEAVECVMEDAKIHFAKSLRLGEPQLLASDDLIALLAAIIVQSDCSDLFSSLYYVENFLWSLADADRLSYTLVTFRAAVEYIRGKEVEKWLPKKTESTGKASPRPSLSPAHRGGVVETYDGPLLLDGSAMDSHHHHLAPHHYQNSHRPGTDLPSSSVGAPVISNSDSPKVDKKTKSSKSDLGPFLSRLMESDGTVTSSSYYNSSSS